MTAFLEVVPMPGWGEGRDRGRVGCLKGVEQPPRKACSNILVLPLLPFFTGLGAWVSFLTLQSSSFPYSLPPSNPA